MEDGFKNKGNRALIAMLLQILMLTMAAALWFSIRLPGALLLLPLSLFPLFYVMMEKTDT